MKKLFAFLAFTFMAAIFLFASGCSSGGSGGGSSYNPPSIDPGSGPTSGTGTSVSSAKGYVYYVAAKSTGTNLIYSPTQLSGYTPAAGAMVTLQTTPPMSMATDGSGYFDFKVDPTYFASQRINLLIEFLNNLLIQPVMPVKPIEQISMLRVMSSNSNDRDLQVVAAGSSTTLMLTDMFGNVVQENVVWSLSDPAMGSMNGGIYNVGSTGMNGTITATVNGNVVKQQQVTITTNTAAFYGTVKDSGNKSVSNLIVTIKGFGVNYSNYGITDAGGNYRIENVPNGYNYTVDITDKAGNAITYTREGYSNNPPHNLIINQTQSSTATMMVKTVTDKMTYKPGDTVTMKVEITNMSGSTVTINNSSVKYTLVEEDYFNMTKKNLVSVSGTTGVITIQPYSRATSANQLSFVIPATANGGMMKFYTIKPEFTGINFNYIYDTSIFITTDAQIPNPGGSGGSPTDDKSILGNAYSQLWDAYYTLNDAANSASSSGQDVSEKVNASSILVFKLELVRDNILYNYSNTTLKNSWKNQINSIKTKLDRYVNSKDASYLREARSDLASLKNEVEYQKSKL